jgi:hypothetical protein
MDYTYMWQHAFVATLGIGLKTRHVSLTMSLYQESYTGLGVVAHIYNST